ncbi:MAG TPA: NUDIX hydrolase, partial [Thermodesulfobacteriota bacterium]
MYLTREAIAACERRFGVPRVVALETELTPAETDRLVASQRWGRAHDVTFFVLDPAKRVVVIRKPDFPPGCWRPPSGGVEPGEGIEAGVWREAREETGLDIALERYVVRVDGRFVEQAADGPGRVVPWTSHVFTARVTSGRL